MRLAGDGGDAGESRRCRRRENKRWQRARTHGRSRAAAVLSGIATVAAAEGLGSLLSDSECWGGGVRATCRQCSKVRHQSMRRQTAAAGLRPICTCATAPGRGFGREGTRIERPWGHGSNPCGRRGRSSRGSGGNQRRLACRARSAACPQSGGTVAREGAGCADTGGGNTGGVTEAARAKGSSARWSGGLLGMRTRLWMPEGQNCLALRRTQQRG